MKVAITSSNGKLIDTEFAKAKNIYVYELKGNKIQQIEKRETNQFSINSPQQSFSRNSFERVYETIKDCDVTYTQLIKDIPRQRCKLLGLKVEQFVGDINEILAIF
jgi:hypothetical protein